MQSLSVPHGTFRMLQARVLLIATATGGSRFVIRAYSRSISRSTDSAVVAQLVQIRITV